MSELYESYIDLHSEIKPGMFIEIVSVDEGHRFSYPDVGSIVPVVKHRGGPCLDCEEWGLGIRNGYGLTYKLVGQPPKLKGISLFLKERGL